MKWRWPWRRAATKNPPPVTAAEAREARRCAEQALQDAHARGHEVRSVVGRLRRQRSRNHFSELILNALREGR